VYLFILLFYYRHSAHSTRSLKSKFMDPPLLSALCVLILCMRRIKNSFMHFY